ncbi:Tuberous sclerosis 1 [Sphaceloma murrayae]|uniref:Tuberous sclerosis 1 n=1 Tax=Sphaceloma murrayae TaxID=2082308 RepID=A0A2K1R2U9_9PEZI|nr:Tuberous sclerosis 1 [Sphaceloma murrayae]
MTKYNSAGVEVTLATIDLAASVPPRSERVSGRQRATADIQASETALNGAKGAREHIVLDQSGSPIRFISKEPAPFIIVEALREDSGSDLSKTSSTRAVVLTVDISKWCEVRRLNRDSAVKIEVFYNGDFAGSRFVPGGRKAEGTSQDAVQRFSGRRIERTSERPWTVMSTTTSEGSDSCITDDAQQQRWSAVAMALRIEAAHRGVNRWGEPSPVSQFLLDIADVPYPTFKHKTPESSTVPLGVIDVVVSLGSGKKHDTTAGYCDRPTRMEDKDYKTRNAVAPNILRRPRASRSLVIQGQQQQEPAPRDRPSSTTSTALLSGAEAGDELTLEVMLAQRGHDGHVALQPPKKRRRIEPDRTENPTHELEAGQTLIGPTSQPFPSAGLFISPETSGTFKDQSVATYITRHGAARGDLDHAATRAPIQDGQYLLNRVDASSIQASVIREAFDPAQRVGKAWTTPACALARFGVTKSVAPNKALRADTPQRQSPASGGGQNSIQPGADDSFTSLSSLGSTPKLTPPHPGPTAAGTYPVPLTTTAPEVPQANALLSGPPSQTGLISEVSEDTFDQMSGRMPSEPVRPSMRPPPKPLSSRDWQPSQLSANSVLTS